MASGSTYRAPTVSLPQPRPQYDLTNESQFRRGLEKTFLDITAYIERLIHDPVSVAGHGVTHENGGADEISVAGLSGLLADAQTPLAHTHTFASLTSKPTTIGGYGITDFNSLGDARWSLLAHTHVFADITDRTTAATGITKVGTINTGVWQGTSISTTYTDAKIKGSGTADRLARMTDSVTVGASLIRDDGTYLGIGGNILNGYGITFGFGISVNGYGGSATVNGFSGAAVAAANGDTLIGHELLHGFNINSKTGVTVANLFVRDSTTTGTPTIHYAVYIDNVTGGTTKYALFTNSGLVAFGDNVSIASGKKLTLNDADITRAAAGIVGVPKLAVGNYAAATIGVGVLADKIEVFDLSGGSLGFIPVYATIT